MKKAIQLMRSGPDYLIEELTVALSNDAWFEFKPLFLVVYAQLRQRKAIGGGEEMLRLRAYEKLQNLVRNGCVEKSGKKYRGIRKALEALKAQTEAQAAARLAHTSQEVVKHVAATN
jgi:hypothetical protein